MLYFLLWIRFSFCPIFLLLKKMSFYSLNSIAIFTLYAVFGSLLFSERIQCIFDFRPISLPIGFPLNTAFILPATLLLVGSKNFDWYSLKWNKCLCLKFFINTFRFGFIGKTVCISEQQISINFFNKALMETMHQPNWLQIFNHLYKVLIIDYSWLLSTWKNK